MHLRTGKFHRHAGSFPEYFQTTGGCAVRLGYLRNFFDLPLNCQTIWLVAHSHPAKDRIKAHYEADYHSCEEEGCDQWDECESDGEADYSVFIEGKEEYIWHGPLMNVVWVSQRKNNDKPIYIELWYEE
jgi:hypothetical protein